MGHDVGNGDADSLLPQKAHQANGLDGVAPQQEEVIEGTQLVLDAENFSEGPCQGALCLIGRRHIFAALPFRLRQSLPVDLATGSHRHGGKGHIDCGHHIIRQRFGQEMPQFFCIDFAAFRRGIVKDELFPPHFGRHRFDTGKLSGSGFDLSHLDAEAPEFHLGVDTTQIFQLSFLIVAGQISRAVHLLPRQEGTIHKALGRKFRLLPIPFGELAARKAQFSRHSLRQKMPISIADKGPGIGYGSADGDGSIVLPLFQLKIGGIHGEFRGAVGVINGTAHIEGTRHGLTADAHVIEIHHLAAGG